MSMPQAPQQGGSLFLTIGSNIVTAINGLTKAIMKAFPSVSGTFTMPAGAGASLAVAQPIVQSNSVVILTPMNHAAAVLQGSANALFVTLTAGTGFSVTTAGTSAGTEIFAYSVVTP